MQIDDIVQLAIQDAGLLNFDDFLDLGDYDVAKSNLNENNDIKINQTITTHETSVTEDPFSMAIKQLEQHNAKQDEILFNTNGYVKKENSNENIKVLNINQQQKQENLNQIIRVNGLNQTTIRIIKLNTNGTINDLINSRNINKSPIKTVQVYDVHTKSLKPINTNTKPNTVQITKVVPRNLSTNTTQPIKPIIRDHNQYQLKRAPIHITNVQTNLNTNIHTFVQNEDEEIIVDEEEELGHAETYADYMPSKLQLGIRHPDPVVETSSLASVEAPDVWYNLRIPESIYATGALSALQLEAIVYACQKHESFLPNNHRSGFLIGDGAGVGKGRTIAGIIYENYLCGRKKALWLSVSNDLKYDAERDFSDIGALRIKVNALNKLKYSKISSKSNSRIKKGVIFATYSSLIGESQQSSTKKKYNTRLKQLLQWLGKDFDGIVVFDECHKAKNLVPVGSAKPTKTGLAVLELQEKLPKARIVYASATGASEPKNMAYMVRLGLWGPGTPFSDFNEFIQCIEKRGVGAMEIVAMDMKLRGMYMARQLSFSGVTFRVEELKLTDEYTRMYNDSVKLWVLLKEKFQDALELVDTHGRLRKTVWGQFWSAHQRFFKYLCMASKVTRVIDITRNALHSSKCVVIGLQSTGEARTLEQIDEYGEINEFISTARGVLQNLIEKHFPILNIDNGQKCKDTNKNSFLDILGIGDHIRDRLNSKKQNNNETNKNSKKVNEILKRLTSYTNQINNVSEKIEKCSNPNTSTTDSSASNTSSEEYEESDDETEIINRSNEQQQQQQQRQIQNLNRIKSLDSDTSCDTDDSDSLFSVIRHRKPIIKGESINLNDKSNHTEIIRNEKIKKFKKIHLKHENNENSIHICDSYTPDNGADNDDGDDNDDEDDESNFNDDFNLPVKRIKIDENNNNNNSGNQFDKSQTIDELKKSKNVNSISKYLNDTRNDLMQRLADLSKRLPANTLDELIENLDGPNYVAEMTGRKGRIVSNDDGHYIYETRSENDVPLELLNIVQKERFMNGDKLIAIISEAASSGISLQANRRYANQRRRVHITIELPWSADRAIQQFGRTHRSNQVSAPEYIFLISELAGEKRFASTVAKRLECLGALTHGDRRATESRDLSQFNIDNKYGRIALENVIKSICGLEKPLAKTPQLYKSDDFLLDARNALIGVGLININSKTMSVYPDKDYMNINKFLNRLLGCPVHLQNAIFTYFSDVLAAVILDAKRTGKWDMGILDLGTNSENVQKKEVKYFILNQNSKNESCNDQNENRITLRRVELHTVIVERGLSWDKALELYSNLNEPQGFYLSNQMKNNHRFAILAIDSEQYKKLNGFESDCNKLNNANLRSFCIYRPNTGLQVRQETLETLRKKYKRVQPLEAKTYWDDQYYKSVVECTHVYRQGICKNIRSCELGLRNRKYHVLAGSVLTVWTKIENILCSLTGSNQTRLQIIRIRTKDNEKIVGCVIPNVYLQQIESLLNSLSIKTFKHKNDDTLMDMNNLLKFSSSSNLLFNNLIPLNNEVS